MSEKKHPNFRLDLPSRLPARFRQVSLDDYRTDGGMGDPEAKAEVAQYIQDLKRYRESGVGLTLSGLPGRGKTMLAVCVLRAALLEGHSGHFMKLSSYHQTHLRMFDLKDAWMKTEDHFAYHEWSELTRKLDVIRKKVEFLVIDEVGKEHKTTTRYIEDAFDYLLRDRYDRGLPTIITTNLLPDEWGTQYSSSMESFIHEATLIVQVAAERDYRK